MAEIARELFVVARSCILNVRADQDRKVRPLRRCIFYQTKRILILVGFGKRDALVERSRGAVAGRDDHEHMARIVDDEIECNLPILISR